MNWLYSSICCFVSDMFLADILRSKVQSNIATSLIFNAYITIQYLQNVNINEYLYGYLLYEITNDILQEKENMILFYAVYCSVIEHYPDIYTFLSTIASISTLLFKMSSL